MVRLLFWGCLLVELQMDVDGFRLEFHGMYGVRNGERSECKEMRFLWVFSV